MGSRGTHRLLFSPHASPLNEWWESDARQGLETIGGQPLSFRRASVGAQRTGQLHREGERREEGSGGESALSLQARHCGARSRHGKRRQAAARQGTRRPKTHDVGFSTIYLYQRSWKWHGEQQEHICIDVRS